MKTLAQAVVELAGFLDTAEHVTPLDAERELTRLGALLSAASADERAALRDAARARASEHPFYAQFSFSFGLEDD